MEKLNVLYTSDEKFIDFMLASIISLVENSNISEIFVHIITSGFSLESYRKVNLLLEQYHGLKIEYYPLENFDIDQFKIPNWRGTQIANARLFFQEILKDNLSEIDNLLYLDSDTIVVGDLNDLEMYKNYTLNAVMEHIKLARLKQIQLPAYYNSGVLFFNVEQWIKNSCQEKIIKNCGKNEISLKYPDQDLLNISLANEVYSLPLEYNLGPAIYLFGNIGEKLYFNSKIKQVPASMVAQAKKNPKILHAYGLSNIKPWVENKINPYNEEFMKYLIKANPKFTKEEVSYLTKVFANNIALIKMAVLFQTYLPKTMEEKLEIVKEKVLTIGNNR